MIQSSGRMKIDQMFAALAMRILSADVFKAVVSRLTLRFDRYAMLMFPFDAPWITMSLTNLTKPGKAPLSRQSPLGQSTATSRSRKTAPSPPEPPI